MGLLDQLVASKIQASKESKEKAEKKVEASTINRSILEMAQQTGDQSLIENINMMVEAIGDKNPDASKLVYKTIEDRVKKQTETAKASGIIEQAGKPGGVESLQEKFPMGIKASEGGVSVDVPSTIEQKIKAQQEKQKKAQSAETEAKGTYRFLQQFQRSYDELKQFDPEVGEIGVGGFLSRKTAKIAENLDALPETKALKIQIQPLANGMAREIEGGKITDKDREIYANSFASAVNFPTKTNVRLMSNNLINLLDKGGDENGAISKQLKQLSSTKSDIFNSVIEQVLIEYPEMTKKIFGDEYEVSE